MNQIVATLPISLRQRVDDYWSRFLAFPSEALNAPGLTLTTAPVKPGLFMLTLGEGLICALSPDVASALGPQIRALSGRTELFSPETVSKLLSQLGPVEMVYGPGEVLYCTGDSFKDGDPLGRRLLTPDDAEALAVFRHAVDWDTDYHRAERFEDWGCAYGIFDGITLASAARVWVWDNRIGAISVVTRSDYRNLGYGLAVVRGCTRWMLKNTRLIPQMDGEVEQAGVRMARASGYVHYGYILVSVLNCV